jgi:hypothetical protein
MAGGYGTLGGGKRGVSVYAHRMSYMLFIGEIPPGVCVLHRCDNPRCVKPTHLFLGTQADNNRDMKEKGRARGPYLRGEYHPAAKLRDEQVIEIRAAHSSGESTRRLAELYGVRRRLITEVVAGRTYIHAASER